MEHLRGLIEGLEVGGIAGVAYWVGRLSQQIELVPNNEEVNNLQIKTKNLETFLEKKFGYSPVDTDL